MKELLTRFITCDFIVCKDIFVSLSFDVLDKLWVFIRPVPEVSLLIKFTLSFVLDHKW